MGERLPSLTYSVRQAAQLAGIGERTAYDLVHRGEFPGARRFGGRWVVSKMQFHAFLDGTAAASTPASEAPTSDDAGVLGTAGPAQACGEAASARPGRSATNRSAAPGGPLRADAAQRPAAS